MTLGAGGRGPEAVARRPVARPSPLGVLSRQEPLGAPREGAAAEAGPCPCGALWPCCVARRLAAARWRPFADVALALAALLVGEAAALALDRAPAVASAGARVARAVLREGRAHIDAAAFAATTSTAAAAAATTATTGAAGSRVRLAYGYVALALTAALGGEATALPSVGAPAVPGRHT